MIDTRVDVSEALAALSRASRALADGAALDSILAQVAEAAVHGSGAEIAVVWLPERSGSLVARLVRASSSALAAEIEGLRAESIETAAELVRALLDTDAVGLTVQLDADRSAGALGLARRVGPFDREATSVAMLAGDLAWLATRLCDDRAVTGREVGGPLDVAGDALAAVADDEAAAARLARLAATTSGAESAHLWRLRSGELEIDGAYGPGDPDPNLKRVAQAVLDEHRSIAVQGDRRKGELVTLQLGEPPLGALQLRFAPGRAPDESGLAGLASFAVRAAHALRSSERAREAGFELERSRALLAVVGEAIARLSLSHTLDTALERLGDMLGTDRDRGLSARGRRPHRRRREPGRRRTARGRRRSVVRHRPRVSPGWRRGRGRRRVVGRAARLGSRRGERVGDRQRARIAARRRRRAHWPTRRLSAPASPAERQRARAARRARRTVGGRGAERAPARAGDGARPGARGGTRLGAGGCEEAECAVQDLALVRAESLARDDAGRARGVDRDLARGRRGRDPDARRARDRAGRTGRVRERRARRRRCACVALAAAAAAAARAAGTARAKRAAAARRRPGGGARRRARSAGAVPAQGLERGDRPDRNTGRAARNAHDRLSASRSAGRRGDRRHGALDCGTGRARDRQRPSLCAAKGVRRHDAALAPAARRARDSRPRAR